MRQFLGLFVVPLLVVVMCVGVFVLFGWVAYDRNSVQDYLNDLRDTRSVFAHRRKQAAYELSKILSANPDAIRNDPSAAAELRQLFGSTEDLWVKRYLALVLGHIEDRQAVPQLIEAAGDDADGDSQTRIYSLWALGAIGDERARDALVQGLRSDDAGIRKTAAFALGGIAGGESRELLLPLLEDPVADVRWNASLALAELGSDAGEQELVEMLDRERLAQVPGITPQQQEEAMIGSLRALVSLHAVGEHAAAIRSIAENDPSYKVRQAAIEARREIDRGDA